MEKAKRLTRDDLADLDPDEYIAVEHLVISELPFRRAKVGRELSHAGFLYKEYRNWWGSDFKILGSYEVQKLINLFNWLDGNEEIIRSGKPTEEIKRTIVKPRF